MSLTFSKFFSSIDTNTFCHQRDGRICRYDRPGHIGHIRLNTSRRHQYRVKGKPDNYDLPWRRALSRSAEWRRSSARSWTGRRRRIRRAAGRSPPFSCSSVDPCRGSRGLSCPQTYSTNTGYPESVHTSRIESGTFYDLIIFSGDSITCMTENETNDWMKNWSMDGWINELLNDWAHD